MKTSDCFNAAKSDLDNARRYLEYGSGCYGESYPSNAHRYRIEQCLGGIVNVKTSTLHAFKREVRHCAPLILSVQGEYSEGSSRFLQEGP